MAHVLRKRPVGFIGNEGNSGKKLGPNTNKDTVKYSKSIVHNFTRALERECECYLSRHHNLN